MDIVVVVAVVSFDAVEISVDTATASDSATSNDCDVIPAAIVDVVSFGLDEDKDIEEIFSFLGMDGYGMVC